MGDDMDRLIIVLTKEEVDRIHEYPDGMSVDLHGKNKREAKKLLNNIINTIRHPFKMEVIHGYNHGTALKEMLYTETINPRITSKEALFYNMGKTIVSIS